MEKKAYSLLGNELNINTITIKQFGRVNIMANTNSVDLLVWLAIKRKLVRNRWQIPE